MTLSLSTLLPLVLLSVRNPRDAAQLLLSLSIPREAVAPALALVVVLSVLLASLGAMIDPAMPEGAHMPLTGLALMIGGFLSAYIGGIHWGGRLSGGQGTLRGAAILMIFLQFVLLVGQVVQIVLWIVAPPLAGFFVIAAALLALWININFIDVLQGYGSLLKSFLLWLLVSLGIAMVAMFLLTLAGVSLQG